MAMRCDAIQPFRNPLLPEGGGRFMSQQRQHPRPTAPDQRQPPAQRDVRISLSFSTPPMPL
eukprot:1211855-Lingulodinium_polyedra.AAC.1